MLPFFVKEEFMLPRSNSPADAMIDKIIAWADKQDNVRAVLMVGSRARADHAADQWSDIDVVVLTKDVRRYRDSTDWLDEIGTVWVTHLEKTATGDGVERRALFADGVDVDFILVPHDEMARLTQDPGVADTIRRGLRVLIDKDRMMSRITLPMSYRTVYQPPTEAQFLNVVNDFWYHAVWTTKKLLRGELWVAKTSCDGYMKNLLLTMLEWHTRATKKQNYDTWFGGRFLEEWADPRAVEKLREAYSSYDAADVQRALLATMQLFRWLATETADSFTYDYPGGVDTSVTAWVKQNLPGQT